VETELTVAYVSESETEPRKTEAPKKRRLPVVQNVEAADESDLDRPPWHWSAIGVIAIFLVWLPLATLATALLKGMIEGIPPDAMPVGAKFSMLGLHAAAFAFASLCGGLLVGRFGVTAGRKEATVSGVVTAALAWLLAIAGGGVSAPLAWALLLVIMIAVGGGFARAGGSIGLRSRQR
jgi:MFS family permease